MLVGFFYSLKNGGVPVSLKEFMSLLEAMEKKIVFSSIDDFYFLSRLCLVKDEKYFDKFDRAFGFYFRDLKTIDDVIEALIPDEWLRKEFEKFLTEEEKKKLDSLGGLERLIEEFKKRLQEQKERHQGGNKWIGTGGTSPLGNGGFNPEGIKVGDSGGGQKRAVKVWEKRNYRNLDDSVELGTRNIKVALKKLRKFARTGAQEELDITDTIRSTAKNAGYLDIRMVPEKHNAVKLLLFLDVGGSMDPYVQLCQELFSAAKTEFKHLEYFYFHNFIYDFVWKDNIRRFSETTHTLDVLHKYSHDYKVVFVGDASMSHYEISSVGGNVEYYNEEPGAVWMKRLTDNYHKIIWLNPTPRDQWEHTQSITMVRKLLEDKMFPLTIDGITRGIQALK